MSMKPQAPRQEKPYPKFPLFWHKRGYWCVKRKGKHINYGPEWQAAYDRFREDEKLRKQGLWIRSGTGKITLGEVRDRFIAHQGERAKAGEIKPEQLCRYIHELGRPAAGITGRLAETVSMATRIGDFVGPDAPDLFTRIRHAALKRGLNAGEKHIVCVRAMMTFASRRKLVAQLVDFGDWFKKPSQTQVRAKRELKASTLGPRTWSLDQLRTIVAAAKERSHATRLNERNINLWAAVMIGLNCGYGAADLAALPLGAYNREGRTLRFPRPKTGRPRLNPLWPETVEAIEYSLIHRPQPTGDGPSDRMFLTKNGRPYRNGGVALDASGMPVRGQRNDPMARTFRNLLRKHGIPRVHGSGLYTLRAMCRVLLLGSGADDDLVSVIMGRQFRYPLDDYYIRADLRDKLRAITDKAHDELFPPAAPEQAA